MASSSFPLLDAIDPYLITAPCPEPAHAWKRYEDLGFRLRPFEKMSRNPRCYMSPTSSPVWYKGRSMSEVYWAIADWAKYEIKASSIPDLQTIARWTYDFFVDYEYDIFANIDAETRTHLEPFVDVAFRFSYKMTHDYRGVSHCLPIPLPFLPALMRSLQGRLFDYFRRKGVKSPLTPDVMDGKSTLVPRIARRVVLDNIDLINEADVVEVVGFVYDEGPNAV